MRMCVCVCVRVHTIGMQRHTNGLQCIQYVHNVSVYACACAFVFEHVKEQIDVHTKCVS